MNGLTLPLSGVIFFVYVTSDIRSNTMPIFEFRCLECGSIGRSRFSALKKEERKVVTIATAR